MPLGLGEIRQVSSDTTSTPTQGAWSTVGINFMNTMTNFLVGREMAKLEADLDKSAFTSQAELERWKAEAAEAKAEEARANLYKTVAYVGIPVVAVGSGLGLYFLLRKRKGKKRRK